MGDKITITANGLDYDIVPKGLAIKNNGKIISQSIGAINKLLTSLEISKIVYVDDKCSINELKDDFIAKILELQKSKPNVEFFNEQWNKPIPVLRKFSSDLWDDKDEKTKRELYIELLKLEDDKEDLENSLAPLSLKNHLKDKIDLLSPTQWVQTRNEILAGSNANSKLLILFDIDFGKSPLADGRSGLDLASEVLNDGAVNQFLFCGIFSHLFNVEEENEKRNEYSVGLGIDKKQFYTISKKRFIEDVHLPALAEGIKNALLIDKVEELKEKSFEILKKSFKKSLKEIDSLSPESFNYAIQKSSKQEGVWEVDTLFRLSSVITKSNALETISSKSTRDKIYKTIESIREIENINTGGDTPLDKSPIIKIREKEIYTSGNILNTIHYPITNGDIFKIDKKHYVLLTQPCNLAMRKEGKRNRNYNTGFLVELQNKTLEDYLSMSFSQRAICEKMEDKNANGTLSIAQFSTFKIIDLHILDLCVFNMDGFARIKIDEVTPSSIIIPQSWVLRYKNIIKLFVKYTTGISTYNKLKSSNKEHLKDLVFYSSSFRDIEIDNINSFNNRNKILKFEISRTANYKSPYADDLLQKFMQYLSRNAFEHDFTA